MKLDKSRILPVLLISYSFIINGCTLYGVAGGALADARKSDYEIVNRENYNNIRILSEITIYQTDRSIKKGKLIEITEDYLTLETLFGLESVNREEIFNIEIKSKKNGIWYGLGIGFALDIAYVALLTRSIAAEGN